MEIKIKKYLVIGGIPYLSHTGTIAYIGLKKFGVYDTLSKANMCMEENYDKCSGLIEVFAIETASID